MRILKTLLILCCLIVTSLPLSAQSGAQCVDDATISFFDGSTDDQLLCQADGDSLKFRFTTSSLAMPFGYLVVDNSGTIIFAGLSTRIDFSLLPPGDYRVFAFSWLGQFLAEPGQNIADAELASICFALTTNSIRINTAGAIGGMVSTEDGLTTVNVCPGDGNPDVIAFDSTATSNNDFVYVVTDENNVILEILAGDSQDFDGAAAGTCRVWGLAYTGNITAMVGDTATLVPLSDGCYGLSSNFVTIIREVPEGGMVSMESGATIRYTCPGDDNPDIVVFDSTGTSNTPYVYVITDENNIILDIVTDDNADFENAPVGTCRVWGLAYTGNLTAMAGDDAAAVDLSDDCFDLSDNFITVIREVPDGGTVAMPNGETEEFTCPGDGMADIIMFDSTGTSNTPYIYVITDDNNIILAIASGDSQDFEGAGTGICRVWGLAYTGNITAMVGDDAAAVALSDDCFDLSDNFITVVREAPEAGTVALPDGSTEILICPDDGKADIVSFDSLGTSNSPYVYLITHDDNIIIEILDTDSRDFDLVGSGECRVWGLAYTGNLTAMVGDDAAAVALSDDCFDLSDNFITVIREVPDGGSVAMPNGETTITICPGDGNADIVMFDSTGTSNTPYVYVITDDNNIILEVVDGDSADFDAAPPGVCRVWGVAYTGIFTGQPGDDASDTVLANDCFDLSDNFITVIREAPEGGTVSTDDGLTEINTCPGDGEADLVNFDSAGTSNTPYIYVITDEENKILAFATGDSFDFEGAGAGICRVWGLAYTGNLTANVGDNAAAVALSDDCFDLSDNFINVIREEPDGGLVFMPNGLSQLIICPGDGNSDVVMFDSVQTSNTNYVYLITTDQGEVLSINQEDSQDFDGAPEGICYVYGLAYTGELLVETGNNVNTTLLSDACFDLSDNFITVIREVPDGGSVATPEGLTEVNICPNDANPDIVEFVATDNSPNTSYIFLITDANDIILGLTTAGELDFNTAGIGDCRVYGVSFTGNLQIGPGANAVTAIISDDCFDLSDNYLRVIREIPEGGTVSTEDGLTEVTTCPGDGLSDIISFDSTGTSNSLYAYVITDENNIILAIADGDSQDFDGAGAGVCRVWGLAYTGNITAMVGDDAAVVALTDDCFDLSDNFVTVIREEPEGGQILLTGSMDESIFLCPDGDQSTLLSFDSTGTNTADYVYIATDENNIIVATLLGDSQDFGFVPEGTYRIWGLAYTGNLTVNPGDDASQVALSDGCFDLTDNFITVILTFPEAGTITDGNGEIIVTICSGDGEPDLVEFVVTGQTVLTDYAYLVTDEDGFLIGILDEDSFDFDNASEGDWRVYGLAYTGSLLPFPGDNIFEVDLSSECFDLTDNFIFLDKDRVNGGTVFAAGDDDEVFVCAEDGTPDILTFVNTSSAPSSDYVYILTTETNIVLSIISGSNFDFETLGFDRTRVWGISYTGNLMVQPGTDLTTSELSDACADLSDNFITVVRDLPEGGEVALEDGSVDILLCVGGVSGDLVVTTTSTSNSGYVYVVTDTANIIVDIDEDLPVSFADYEPGFYRVWGLSYTGQIIAEVGDNAALVDLANSCFDLSDNFITVERSPTLTGGTIENTLGDTIVYTCPGDGVSDIIALTTTSPDTGFFYVITDNSGNVLIPRVENDVIDFDGAAPGICRIYGVSIIGESLILFGDNIQTSTLSSYCWALSDNFITVVRQEPDGGTVSTADGDTEVTIIIDDGVADSIFFDNTGITPTPYTYVITDENNIILGSFDSGVFDFEGTDPGVCRVWGLSYTGNLTAFVGDDAAAVNLSDDCFDLSDNFVTINRAQGFGGSGNSLSTNTQNVPVNLSGIGSVAVAPNPASDEISVRYLLYGDRNADQTAMILVGTDGQILFNRKLASSQGRNDETIDISNLPSGIYFLRLQNAGSVETIRFIKR